MFLKELCVLYDSVFQTSTSNLKFSRRVAEITEHRAGAESVLLRGVLHSNWLATIVARRR